MIVPGTYDLYFTPPIAVAGAPGYGSVKLRTGIVVSGASMTLNADIPATPVSGKVTIGGATISNFADGVGLFSLVSAGGDNARLTTTMPGSYSTLVIPGTYDLRYEVSHPGPAIPNNSSATIKTGIVVGTAPLTLDIDVPTATVAGVVTVNGAAITDPTNQGVGVLELLDSSGNRAGIALTSSSVTSPATSAYSALVIPGSYEIFYTVYRPGPGVPSNGDADLGCFMFP